MVGDGGSVLMVVVVVPFGYCFGFILFVFLIFFSVLFFGLSLIPNQRQMFYVFSFLNSTSFANHSKNEERIIE